MAITKLIACSRSLYCLLGPVITNRNRFSDSNSNRITDDKRFISYAHVCRNQCWKIRPWDLSPVLFLFLFLDILGGSSGG